MKEQEMGLPEGWELKKLKEIITLISGQDLKPEQYSEKEIGIPYITGASNFNNGSLSINRYTNEPSKIALKNDLLLTCKGTVGEMAFLQEEKVHIARQIMAIRQNSLAETQFIYFYLKREIENLKNKAKGLIPGIGRQDLLNIDFPLPPLPEQQHLSQKLTALLDGVAEAKQRLEKIPALLKQFRQSVLADAVSGKLTDITPLTAKMSDVALFQNGFAFNSEDFTETGAWQVLRLGNIRDGFIFYDNKPVFIPEELAKLQEKFIPNAGDSLISMTGTRLKQDYGFSCIIKEKQKILINQRVGRIIPSKEKIVPEYLNLFIRSELFRQQFFKGETGGVNQGNVGSKHIMSIMINLPSLPEQTQIIQKVETYFALADKIETEAANALEKVNLLTQSILAKAFRGELSADWRAENKT